MRAAFPAIRAGSPRDTILVGELAASGSVNRGPDSAIRPLAFLRAFGCVDRSFRKVRTGRCRGFNAATGGRDRPPPVQLLPEPVDATRPTATTPRSATAARLLRFLDRLVRRGGLVSTRGPKLDVHYTEFGYQTNPPDPYAGISLKRQDRWLQEAAKVAWATPRVRTYSQFRLTDGPVLPGGGFAAYREFQTGLMFRDMRKKPSYASFRHPFVIKRRGKRLRLWGQVRPGGRHDVTIERKRGGAWSQIATATTTRRGYWQRGIRRRAGTYRYRWGAGKSRTSDAHPRPLAACKLSCRIRRVPSAGVRTFTNTCSPPPSSAFV